MEKIPNDQPRNSEPLKAIRQAIIDGNNDAAIQCAADLIRDGMKPEEIIIAGVTKAMEYLDKKCTIREFCLLELMLAGRAAMDVIDFLNSELITRDEELINTETVPERKIVLGTVKGDIHEIGKNIVSMVMRTYRYGVIDLGKDVDPEVMVAAAIEHQADVIGVSSLITTTINNVREVRKAAIAKGLPQVKIIAGGAALKQSNAAFLDVDFVADTVFDGLQYLKRI